MAVHISWGVFWKSWYVIAVVVMVGLAFLVGNGKKDGGEGGAFFSSHA